MNKTVKTILFVTVLAIVYAQYRKYKNKEKVQTIKSK